MLPPSDSPLDASLENLDRALIKLEHRSYQIPEASSRLSVPQPQSINNISLNTAISKKTDRGPQDTENSNDVESDSAHKLGVQLGADGFSALDECGPNLNITTIKLQAGLSLTSGSL